MNRWIGVLALAGVLTSGCAAEPESQANGSCSLSCSQPRVGSAQYRVRAFMPVGETINVQCLADFNGQTLAPASGPVQVKFQVFELVPKSFPEEPASTGNQGPFPPNADGTEGDPAPNFLTGASLAGGAAMLQEGSKGDNPEENGDQPYLREVPRGGVGFEPILYGGLSVAKTNDEFKTGPDSVSSFKFAGVVTSSSEWCSDSCGIITYEFWPDCRQGGSNAVTAGVAVAGGGGISQQPITEFSFNN